MEEEIIKTVVAQTIEDIERVQGFELSPEELSEYWISYTQEVPKVLQTHISQKIFDNTGVKVYWINGKEVKVVLHEEEVDSSNSV